MLNNEADGPLARDRVAPTLTQSQSPDLTFRAADFDCLAAALDHAAQGNAGLNFHNGRGGLDQVLTYAELCRSARRTAAGLLDLGLRRGDRVAIVAEMGPDFVIAFFACQYAGLVAAPLPEQTGLGTRTDYVATLRSIVHSAGARVVVGPDDLQATLSEVVQGLPGRRAATTTGLMDGAPANAELQPLGAGEISHIQYSSGSTRTPQGIRIDQDALMANARAVAVSAMQIRPGDRAASWLPFYHDMGLIGFLLIPLTCQVSVDYLASDSFARRPLQWLKLISQNRCQFAFSPTFGYDLCTRRAASASALELDLSCWRVAGIGGETVRHQTLEAFADAFAPHGFRRDAFVPSYGLAESTLAVSFANRDRAPHVDWVDAEALVRRSVAEPAAEGPRTSGFTSCGAPIRDHAVAIRDAHGRSLPERRVGRICVRGPSLMHGYDNAPDETAEVLDADGWLDTGDLGYLADGELFVTGRRKDLIIVNGRNILPQDLEWAAEHASPHLRSRDTAAFSVSGPDGREVPVILVQARTQAPGERKEVCNAVHSAIFRSAGIDCRVVLVPLRSLPFTSSGKLSRARARQLYLSGAFEDDALPRAASAG